MKSLAAFACACALCATVSCVSRQTYDQARAEADDAARTLDSERAEIRTLEEHAATLQSMTRKVDAETTEIRAAIRQATDAAALDRQRADDKLAALQTQVASLVNQHRALGRELADAKQEGMSLQATVAHYKR
jgi:chromosome segregation ATPase